MPSLESTTSYTPLNGSDESRTLSPLEKRLLILSVVLGITVFGLSVAFIVQSSQSSGPDNSTTVEPSTTLAPTTKSSLPTTQSNLTTTDTPATPTDHPETTATEAFSTTKTSGSEDANKVNVDKSN